MTEEYMVKGFWGEVDEFNQTLQEVEIGQSAMELAQEAADVLYYGVWLYIHYEVTPQIEAEIIKVFEVLACAGIKWTHSMLLKGHRNAQKHIEPPYAMNGYGHNAHMDVNKQFWKGLDQPWYHMYEQIGDLIYEQRKPETRPERIIIGHDTIIFDSARPTFADEAES